VVAFPAHVVVAAAVDRFWLDSWTTDGDFGTPMSPPFLGALEERLRLSAGNLDAALLAPPLPGPPPIPLTRLEPSPPAPLPPAPVQPAPVQPGLAQPVLAPAGPMRVEPAAAGPMLASPVPGLTPLAAALDHAGVHPRVARALRYRSDVRVWASDHGVLILGRGLAGRWETAIEVHEASRNNGHGRALAIAARHLVPDGRPVWAQVAPGNAASLRTFLAAGYTPVGSEVILTPFPPEAPILHP
jgi:hypothetical protein